MKKERATMAWFLLSLANAEQSEVTNGGKATDGKREYQDVAFSKIECFSACQPVWKRLSRGEVEVERAERTKAFS